MKLAQLFVTQSDRISDLYYFTALAHWDSNKVSRHRAFIKALELTGVEVVFGEFKKKERKCRCCFKTYKTFEEKQTDVNIAVHLFKLAVSNSYDTAIIVSGDSDLIPAITAVRLAFPSKRVGLALPMGMRSEALKHAVDFCPPSWS
jgi:uncharacterized LabA/DUF88 family protein